MDFDDRKDAQDAIRDLNGKHNWRIKLSHNCSGGGDRSGRDRHCGGGCSDLKYYECAEPGYVECESRMRNGSGGLGSSSSDHKSPSEHPYLSTTLAQTCTIISCLISSRSNT